MAQLEKSDAAQAAAEKTLDATGVPVIKLGGEIDISNAHRIGSTLEDLIGAETGHLVVDLSALQFVDSAGIAMLLRAINGVDSVSIRNPSTVVRRILECTGLTEVL